MRPLRLKRAGAYCSVGRGSFRCFGIRNLSLERYPELIIYDSSDVDRIYTR